MPALFGQQAELKRLVAESQRLRALKTPSNRASWTELKDLLRDWIESRLPGNSAELNAAFPGLEARMTAELSRAGLLEPETLDPMTTGYVPPLKLLRPAEIPGALIVQAGISVPCGDDESIYVYRFSPKGRDRLLEEHGKHDFGDYVVGMQFSVPGASGSRMFYAAWNGVQCESNWGELDYRLFRLTSGNAATLVFSDSGSYRRDEPVHVRLTPHELLLEFTSYALEGGFTRTHVLHYAIHRAGVQRIDPVALDPQDFVDEWFRGPWSEMQSRSASGLAKWQTLLHDYTAEYQFVQPCQDRAGATQVALHLMKTNSDELPQPLTVYSLVRDKGDHRYEMQDIGYIRQSGCPGETQADYDHLPSLFKK